MPLFVEIKSAGSGEPELVRRVAATLAQFSGAFAVMSFDPGVLRRMRPLAPDLPLGMIADRFDGPGARSMSPFNRFALRHLLPAPFVRPDFVSYGIHALPANAPLLLRHFGLPLLAWTVRTQDQQQTAKRYADQMTFEGFDPRATGTAREQSA
jgi:glycerophosphoryl diester phosphodiesterase